MRLAVVIGVFSLLAAHAAFAQSEAHPVSAAFLVGTWSTGAGAWPFVLVGGEYRAGSHVTLGLHAGGVSRPVTLCSDAVDDPMCDKRKVIRMLVAQARFEFGARALRPYVGVASGRTWYYNPGILVGLHAGLLISAERRISFRIDGAENIIVENSEAGGATSLQVGASYRL